jgi:hypothetical protein
MLRDLCRNIFSLVFAHPLEPLHALVEHQLHFVQSYVTPEIANEILDFIWIPKHSFLQLILQSSKLLEVTRTQDMR